MLEQVRLKNTEMVAAAIEQEKQKEVEKEEEVEVETPKPTEEVTAEKECWPGG